jgi:hypothetical protein
MLTGWNDDRTKAFYTLSFSSNMHVGSRGLTNGQAITECSCRLCNAADLTHVRG